MESHFNCLPGKIHSEDRYKRISKRGNILSYEDNPVNVVGCYIHRLPLSEEFNYFEIKILDTGRSGSISIGVAPYNYPLSAQPGWRQGSTAYHADDGKLFHDNGFGSPLGVTCSVGDVLGCGIRLSENARAQAVMSALRLARFLSLEIFFTKNGAEIGKISSIISASSGDLYPAVGMHSTGESVELNFSPDSVFAFGATQPSEDAMLIDRLEEEEWSRTFDVIVNGQVIEYASKGKSIRDVGMAQARKCLNTTDHYFEVEILEPGQHCYIAIGLVHKNYPRHRHPGWNAGSVAYHADDGQLFVGKGQGVPFGPRCYKGDLMGCGIWFPQKYEAPIELEECEDLDAGMKKDAVLEDASQAPFAVNDVIAPSDEDDDSSDLDEDEEPELLEGDLENDGFLWLPRPDRRHDIQDWPIALHERHRLRQHLGRPMMWKNMRRRQKRHAREDPTEAIYGTKEKGLDIRVFFTRNGRHVGETKVSMPKYGFYPAVGMLSTNEKVRVDLKPLTG